MVSQLGAGAGGQGTDRRSADAEHAASLLSGEVEQRREHDRGTLLGIKFAQQTDHGIMGLDGSKIIGYRIKNPMWLTLLALVIGERFMGIPGMILAPVFLDYVKVEMSRLPPPSNGKKSEDEFVTSHYLG